MSTGKLLSVSFANLQAASDTTNAKLVTADLKTMSMAQLDLYFTLGIIGTVMYFTRSYRSMSIQALSKWIDSKESTWGGSVNTDYVILNILGKDGTMYLYCKVTRGGTENFDAYPILGKIPGKPWRWSKNVTASEIVGGVIYCPISLKGGVRHEYGRNTANGGETGQTDAERNGVSWLVRGCRFVSYDGNLRHQFNNERSTECHKRYRRHSRSVHTARVRGLSTDNCLEWTIHSRPYWKPNLLECLENHLADSSVLLAHGKEVAA